MRRGVPGPRSARCLVSSAPHLRPSSSWRCGADEGLPSHRVWVGKALLALLLFLVATLAVAAVIGAIGAAGYEAERAKIEADLKRSRT
jgi:hypothetical protein